MSETTEAATAPDGAPAPAEEPTSLRDRLAAAYDEIQTRDEPPPPAEAPEPDTEAPRRAPADRDQQGKFARSETSPPPKPGAAEPVAPPEGWSPKASVDWQRLPRSVQEALRATATAPPPAQAQPDGLREAIRPYEAEFQQRGLTPETGVKSILDVWRALEQNPAETIAWFQQRYADRLGGAQAPPRQEPQQRAQPTHEQAQQPPVEIDQHPVVRDLREQLRRLDGSVSQTQQAYQMQQREATARRVAEAAMEIDRFAKDPANPRPHFDTVREEMAVRIRTGQNADLASAYEAACWANRTVRAAMQAEERSKDVAQAKQDAEARAVAARRAAAVNVRGTPGAAPASRASMRETLEAAYEKSQTGA